MFRSIDASDFASSYATRQMYGLDSQVGLGVLGKGRSAFLLVERGMQEVYLQVWDGDTTCTLVMHSPLLD